MTTAVDTVVFDIGNVLISWDPEHLYKALIPDEKDRAQFLTEVCSPAWNLEQDRGRTWQEALDILIPQFPEKEALIRAYYERWSEMVPGAIKGTVALLAELKDKGVPLYAITNFSSDKFEETRTRFPFLRTSFIDTVISADEKLVKPDTRLYDVLFDRNPSLKREACVFTDDSLANIEGAKKAGMQAVHFESPEKLRADLKRFGLPV